MAMTLRKECGGLTCRCAFVDSTDVCYILLPKPLDDEHALDEWARRYHYNVVEVSGMDWNDDLTPWPAKGFAGHGSTFLDALRHELLPTIEGMAGLTVGRRMLMGVSLSGLFATWAWSQCEDFYYIASISGSFWYDNVAEWLASRETLRQDGCAYFSLGAKERRCSQGRFRTVGERTDKVATTLASAGVATMSQETEGDHFSAMQPRIEKAFEGMAFLRFCNE